MSISSPVLRYPGLGTVHVIGGAHLSKESIHAATKAVKELSPSVVLLELCPERSDMLDAKLDRPAQPLPPIQKLFTEKLWTALNPLFWVVHVPMAGFAALSDTSMGGEMRAAAAIAAKKRIPVHLIDREVSVTMFRAMAAGTEAVEDKVWRGGGSSSTNASNEQQQDAPAASETQQAEKDAAEWFSLYWGMMRGRSLSDEEFRALSMEVQAALNSMLESLEGGHARGGGGSGGSFGNNRELFGDGDVERALFHVIGDERDKVLAYQCVAAAQRVGPGATVVAVVGAAHAEGIKKEWDRICARGWPVLPQHYYLQPRGFARVPESKRALFRQEDEAAINALYDIEQPRQQIIGFCTKALAVDLAAAAAAAGCWRLAKRRGGLFFERTKMLFKAAAASSFLGSLAALSIAKYSYDGVRGLQERRLEIWEKNEAQARS